MTIRLKRGYQGKLTDGYIEAGDYPDDYPPLNGQANYLVQIGRAVRLSPAPPSIEPEPEPAVTEVTPVTATEATGDAVAAPSDEATKEDLINFALAHDIDISVRWTKSEIRDAIDEALGEINE